MLFTLMLTSNVMTTQTKYSLADVSLKCSLGLLTIIFITNIGNIIIKIKINIELY